MKTTKFLIVSTLDNADGIDYEYLYGTEEREHASRKSAQAVADRLNATAGELDWGTAEAPKYSVEEAQ